MRKTPTIDANTLQNWLASGKKINVVDIRPMREWSEWYIPGSVYFDAYEKLKAKDSSALERLHIDKSVPVITVCAAGKTSSIAAELLSDKGYEAYSLKDGMKGWSLSWNTANISFDEFQIIQVRRTGKGCLSYIIASNSEAAIVDASVSADVYEQILEQNNVSLKYVIETHLHADHLSRSRQLAEKNKVPLYLPVPNKVTFAFERIDGTTTFQLGNINIKAIKTPGHTIESVSFLVDDKVLLTGDTLFINGVGRPDLKADAEEAFEKSKLLYQSLQKIIALDDNIIVLPAHTSNPIDFDDKPVQATLSEIKKNVPMLQMNEETFVSTLLQRIPETPANYLSIVEKNLKGDFSDVNPIDLEAGANRCAIS
jgi:glyoxylase-like metal-dependent hydrolase (beta-lactamase superfamily II)/rhodanese-related sulfurtransferase